MNALRQAVAGPSRRAINSFAIAESATTTSQAPPVIERYVQRKLISNPSTSILPNPFDIHRSGKSGSIRPRYISRRREKQLRFWFAAESLPPPPSASSATPFTHTSPDGSTASLSWSAAPSTKVKKTLYEGRRVQFKGHKHEREKPERQRETAERMAGMEKRIAEWKRNKLEAKASTKPSLPF